jgi:hypothetical protein
MTWMDGWTALLAHRRSSAYSRPMTRHGGLLALLLAAALSLTPAAATAAPAPQVDDEIAELCSAEGQADLELEPAEVAGIDELCTAFQDAFDAAVADAEKQSAAWKAKKAKVQEACREATGAAKRAACRKAKKVAKKADKELAKIRRERDDAISDAEDEFFDGVDDLFLGDEEELDDEDLGDDDVVDVEDDEG